MPLIIYTKNQLIMFSNIAVLYRINYVVEEGNSYKIPLINKTKIRHDGKLLSTVPAKSIRPPKSYIL